MLQTLLDSLRIDPRLLLFNGILFLVLLQILDKLFWKPMMRHLDARKHDIQNAYKEVEDTRREIERLRTEYQAKLAEIESDARSRIASTVHDAQKEREQMIAQAHEKAEQIIQQGGASIQQEVAHAILAMRANLDQVALDTLHKAIGAQPDPAQRKLVDQYISDKAVKS